MLPVDRKKMIAEITREKRSVTVDELCRMLNVSGATVRRDLAELELHHQITRTHGGAAFIDSDIDDFPLDIRERDNTEEKSLIADRALTCINDGETIFIDSSSTCGFLAKQFGKFKNLRVITNGMNIVAILAKFPNIETYCTGGRLLPEKQSFVGIPALEFINKHNAQTFFFSCKGFDPKYGVTDSSEDQANIKTAMINRSEKCILLCDSSKFYQSFFCKVCDTDLPFVISDGPVPV